MLPKVKIMTATKPIFLFLFITISSLNSQAQSATTRYIFAPSGLNMRATAEPGSEKLIKIPYGDSLNILRHPMESKMKVDNYIGGMAKVEYQGQEGYVFNGYFSAFPTPREHEEVEPYVERARRVYTQGTIIFELHRYDYDGYIRHEEVMILPIEDFEKAFLVAKTLTGIPKDLYLSDPSNTGRKTFQNPNKGEFAWSDELIVDRGSDGKLKEIIYGYRGEGGGWSVVIEKDKEESGLRITYARIAD